VTILGSNSMLVWPIILPLTAALLAFIHRKRSSMFGIGGGLATVLATMGLAWQAMEQGKGIYQLGGWQPPLGISLRLDGLAILMLLMTAITGMAVSFYARGYFQSRIARVPVRHGLQKRYFWPLWLLLWGALNNLFVTNDLFNMYIALEMVALSSAGLTALSGKPASQVAAMRYLLVSILGSLSFLLGVGFIYRNAASLDLTTLPTLLTSGPDVQLAVAFITVGLLLKTALFPFHFWLPPAHANALAPVSAILSGLVIKASWYVLLRLCWAFSPMASKSIMILLATLGSLAILWGAIQTLRQQRLKMLIAYSTVAQIGFLFVFFPLLPGSPIQGIKAAIYFALSHSCAKAAMFMASGTIFLQLGHDRIRDMAGIQQLLPMSCFAFSLAGLSLMGLPPSGGFIAKYLYISQAINQGNWWLAAVIILGSLLTVAYVYRVVAQLLSPKIVKGRQQREKISSSMEWSALALALMALLLGLIAPHTLGLLEVI